jgi:hypothetical protein
MFCTSCGSDNNETFPSADGVIYCRHCGEPLNDCCFCGSRKGIHRVKDIDTSIRDETLTICEFCKKILTEGWER